MRKLRIGITCYPTFGGSGVIATEIGTAMAERGHKVHFISYSVPRRLQRYTDNIYFHEVEVRDNPLFTYPPYSLALASKMIEVSNYEHLDILHVHYAVPHATSAFMAKSVLKDQAPKVITTLHGTDITLVGTERSYLPITRFSIVESDGVTAPSEFLKHATYDKLNVSTDVKIEVIPNFVDVAKFIPISLMEKPRKPDFFDCKFKDDKKVLVHVSNFRPVKRLGDVVAIFAKVHQEIPSRLVLIGDGPERSRIENMVHEMNIHDDVCFLGNQEDFIPVLQSSNLFLLPSENESFGLAALEALSCGVPVVASNAEGIPEVVLNREVGLLSDVGDIENMAKNALTILTNNSLHEAMSKNARKLVEDRYNKERLMDFYEDYYYRIMAK